MTISVQALSRPEPIDTRNWRLVEFVDHLHAAGLRVRVISSRQDGKWADSIYLCEDPEANWLSFQHKNRNVELIEQWEGAVVVEHIHPEADTQWSLCQWGRNGCRIDRFLVFGDARLVEQIRAAVGVGER